MSTRLIQDIPDREASLKLRDELFVEQIKPAGKFGLDEDLFFSTGNGCAAAIGWVPIASNPLPPPPQRKGKWFRL